MQTILVLHNILRWAILLFGLWTVLNALSGVSGKRAYSLNDNRSNLFFMISCDIQLLLGLVLYFSNNWFNILKSDPGIAMKNGAIRFFTVEHALMMILAWILVHVGRTAVKRAPEDRKHRKTLIFFGLAFILILAAIPWPFRTEIARPLLRWFS